MPEPMIPITEPINSEPIPNAGVSAFNKPKEKKEIVFGDVNELPELKLSETEEKAIIDYCIPKLEDEIAYHDSTIVPELDRYEKIYQMKRPPKTWPFKDCSNVASTIATRAVDAIESRGQKVIWESGDVIATDAPVWATPKEKALIPRIENFLDDTIRIVLQGKPIIRDIWHNASLHRSCIGKLRWVKTVEQVRDIEEYKDLATFQQEYADAKEAGISEEQYQYYIEELNAQRPITIRSKGKDVTKQPVLEIVLRKDFIRPHDTPAYRESEWEGQRMEKLRWSDIEQRVEAGIYSKKAAEKLKEAVDPNWKANEDKEFDPKEKRYRTHEYTLVECVWKYKLKKKELEQKFIFTFDVKNKILVQADYFPYFHNSSYFIRFRVMKSQGWDGVAVPEKLEQIVKQDQDLRNITIDGETILNMPMLKARMGADIDIDSYEFYPGAIWWCKEPEKDIQEMRMSPRGAGLRQDVEKLESEGEMIIGVTAYNSGRETSGDKNAPARKTLALITESNIQINDYKDVFQEGMAELAYQLLMLYYQFSEDAQDYIGGYKLSRQELKRKKSAFKLRGNTISANKDIKRQDAIFSYNLLRKDPMIAARPQSVRKLIEKVIIAMDDDPNGILPSDEVLRAEQVEIQMQAIQKLQAQQKQMELQKQAREMGQAGMPPAPVPTTAMPPANPMGGMGV